MDEKLYRTLLNRRTEIVLAMFTQPPADMVAFRERWGRWDELDRIIQQMEHDAKGIEKD